MSKYLTEAELQYEIDNLNLYDSDGGNCSENSVVSSEEGTSYVLEDALSSTSSDGDEEENLSNIRGTSNISVQYDAADGTKWKILSDVNNGCGRISRHNILREEAGPTGYAKRNVDNTCVSSWRLFIDNSMLRNIQKCTETEASRQLGGSPWTTSMEELDAFISCLYARGIYGAKNFPVDQLWNKTWGPNFFCETMSRDKFNQIKRFIRFDLKSTRRDRQKSDKFAAVSEVWNKFVSNCIMCYKPGANITIDEQLFPTKARCPFTQYMSNKPDKFGIKFWIAADVETKYMLNGFPYLGKDDSRPTDMLLSEHIVIKLMEPFLKKGRNVTVDNFFTSLNLAKNLQKQSTSLVGTVNRSRRFLPAAIKKSRNDLYSTKVFVCDDISLTSYQAKRSKNVCILSSMHKFPTIDEGQKKLPETVKFYNNTKYGVDVLDQMARNYTTKSSSRRWPLQVFFNILDLAAINSWIIYNLCTNENISRRKYILNLADELRSQYVRTRKSTTYVDGSQSTNKRRQCQSKKCGNKSKDNCKICKKVVCGKCVGIITKEIICSGCT